MAETWAWAALALPRVSVAAPPVAAPHPPSNPPVQPFRPAPPPFYPRSRGLSALLVTSPQGAILIDGTVKENAALVERNIEAVGVRLKSVKWIVSDHAHNDHVGALAQIKKDTGARFAASAGDQAALESG